MITKLEELSLNAWPSLQTMLYDGWVLRFSEGYTKRANSINPIYFSNKDIDEKIRFCQELYRNQGLPVVFKLTSTVFPQDLDEKLQAGGYQLDSATSVQTIDLTALNLPKNVNAEFQDNVSDAWLENYCRMNKVSIGHRKTLQDMLTNIIPSHCFASIKDKEKIVACGLGVLQSGYTGLFDIVTDQDFRNRGYGREIVCGILDWGSHHNAHTGYLQVMLNNVPALNLYSKLGFVERYQYWYRSKS